MKYLGDVEHYLGHQDPNTIPKNKHGYAVFNFRMNEMELDVLSMLLDMFGSFNKRGCLYDINGNNLGQIIKTMRRGVREAKKALEESKDTLKNVKEELRKNSETVVMPATNSKMHDSYTGKEIPTPTYHDPDVVKVHNAVVELRNAVRGLATLQRQHVADNPHLTCSQPYLKAINSLLEEINDIKLY